MRCRGTAVASRKTYSMKKFLLFAFTVLCTGQLQAQTTLHKLIDSTGDWSRIYSYDNKLYLGTYFVGGQQYEMDVTTHALTPVANFPIVTAYYESICEDFSFFNGRMSRVLHSGNYHLLVADNNDCDTLLSGALITCISKAANKMFVAVDDHLYTTDFTTTNTVLIDSLSAQPENMYAASDYFYYVKQDPNNSTTRYIIRTDGVTSTTLETVTQSSTLIELIGEMGGSFYYAVTLYTQNPTITIHKVTGTGMPTTVTTQNVGGYISGTFGSGSVAALGKLFMIVRSMTAPYPYDVWAYDLTANTFTQVTDALGDNITYNNTINKTMVSSDAVYFYAGGMIKDLWRTDGTVAGTELYEDSVEIRFFNPQYNSFGLSNTAIMCDQYPVAGMDSEPGTAQDVEYHYGDATGMHKFSLNGANGSYPKDLVKVDDKLYFLATETATQFGKQSLYVVDGCGLPTAISNVNKTQLNVTVSPNPSTGDFTVDGIGAGASVTLYNIQGQKVNTTNTTQANGVHVATNGLPAGIYMLEVRMDGQVTVEKVVIR